MLRVRDMSVVKDFFMAAFFVTFFSFDLAFNMLYIKKNVYLMGERPRVLKKYFFRSIREE